MRFESIICTQKLEIASDGEWLEAQRFIPPDVIVKFEIYIELHYRFFPSFQIFVLQTTMMDLKMCTQYKY